MYKRQHHPWRLRLHLARFACAIVPQGLVRAVQARASRSALFGGSGDPAAAEAFRARGFGGLSLAWRQRLALLTRLDLRPELSRIAAPATVVAARRDRIVPAVRCGRELAAGLGDAPLIVLERGGHLVLPLAEVPWERHVTELAQRAELDRD